jgi:hypothetical protein
MAVDGDERSGAPSPSWLGRVAGAVARHPGLWWTALRQLWALAPNGWWRRRPWLPLPDPAYLRFRLVTQYGDATHTPEPGDVVTYLHWCRAYRAALR